MNDPRGSIWRKWDLQVHTPYSYLCNQFGSDFDVYMQKLFKSAISKHIAAIGITDYFTIEGYKKINSYLNDDEKLQQLFEAEEIQQIKQLLILPNIEFRLDKIVGGKRLEFHIIFSDSVSIRDIEEHFLHDINFVRQGLPFSPDDISKLKIDNLTELGKTLKEQHDEFKGEKDVFVGMMNAVVNDNQLSELLASNKFKGKYLIGLPSDQDLSQIDWNGQDHNIRKVLIQKANFLFASNKNTIAWALGKKHNNKQDFANEFKSFKPCIHSSDAHNYDRLFEPENKRYTWIKADTTFEGLKQIIHEPEGRVYIGDEPEILKRVRNNKTKYIHSFAIRKEEGAILDEIWFSENPEIVINPGLVSIIGNKGGGKSSIADTLGLLGNTQQSSHFSFLNPTKFKDKRDNKAKHFKAIIKWESGDSIEKNLNDEVDSSAVETVKCIPQNYLEKICTEQIEGSLFNDELKKVIFSHVNKAEKLERNKLDDLIEYKTKEKSNSINIAKNEISILNKEIVELEMKLHPDYKTQINNKLQIKKQERASHELTKPKDKTKPGIDPAKQEEIDAITSDIYKKVDNIQTFEKEIERIERERKSDYSKYINSKKLLDMLDNFQKQYDLFKIECKVIAEALSLSIDDIITLEVKKIDIERLRTESWDSYTAKSDVLKEDNKEGPFFKKQQLQKEIDALRDRLDQPNKEYQAFLKEKAEWEIQFKTIDGDESTPDTIKYYEKQITEIDIIPEQLRGLKKLRLSNTQGIFEQLCQLRDEYSTLYKPVKDFADSQRFAKEQFSMDFRVSIICEGFTGQFINFINNNKKGSFYGADEGRKRIKDILDSSDFDSSSGLETFLQQIENNLSIDQRDEYKDKDTIRYVNDQLLKQGVSSVQDFYNYIYSLDYLKPKYILRWAGKDLSQLSPGERGTVLLIFYLFISQDEIPLVIDQPEENLDNETVYGVLVPCIKEAKKRRQIIIVTHNPNLAVVCDAEQIIYSEIDKQNGNRISYTCGAIENPTINKKLIDVLEGTRPAFENRDGKYYVKN